jgi:hypothetical protein
MDEIFMTIQTTNSGYSSSRCRGDMKGVWLKHGIATSKTLKRCKNGHQFTTLKRQKGSNCTHDDDKELAKICSRWGRIQYTN